MSVRIAGDLVKQARREGIRIAADMVQRESDRIMKRAEKFHDEMSYGQYEELEYRATVMQAVAERIRRRARRG